jgi:mannose-binding lectin
MTVWPPSGRDFRRNVMIYYAQTSGNLNTNSGSWTPIAGLALKLPEGVGTEVLVILNVPNPYATGNNYPGGNFGIQVNGQVQSQFAAFTYNEQIPPSTGRIPTTLCVPVQLQPKEPLTVTAVWSGIRNSTVHIDSPASLTAVV